MNKTDQEMDPEALGILRREVEKTKAECQSENSQLDRQVSFSTRTIMVHKDSDVEEILRLFQQAPERTIVGPCKITRS